MAALCWLPAMDAHSVLCIVRSSRVLPCPGCRGESLHCICYDYKPNRKIRSGTAVSCYLLVSVHIVAHNLALAPHTSLCAAVDL